MATKYLDYTGLLYYDLKIKQYSDTKDEERKVVSSDKTIIITPGDTKEVDGETITTNTEISVNIDGNTIIRDNDSGLLSVASSALTQYIGSNAINVSENPDTDNNKTISLKVLNDDNVLHIGNNGLYSTVQLKLLDRPYLDSTSYAEYALFGTNDSGNPTQLIGDTIKIPKDSALVDVSLGKTGGVLDEDTGEYTPPSNGNDALIFIYRLNTGKYRMAEVNLGMFLAETEYNDGLIVEGDSGTGIISVSLSDDIEKYSDSNGNKVPYLRFGSTSDGQKRPLVLTGINSSISNAISNLGSITADAEKYFSDISINNGELIGQQKYLPITAKLTTLPNPNTNNWKLDDGYFTTNVYKLNNKGEITYYISGLNTVKDINSADSSDDDTKGLAEVSDVKDYVDGLISEVNNKINEFIAISQEEIDNLF